MAERSPLPGSGLVLIDERLSASESDLALAQRSAQGLVHILADEILVELIDGDPAKEAPAAVTDERPRAPA